MRFTMLFASLFAVTSFIYGAMIFWTLPAISAGAGGLAPLDTRAFGYSYDEVHAFLNALTPHARGIYLGPQRVLDMIFPGAMALTLCLVFNRLHAKTGTSSSAAALIGVGLALGGATADYFENMAVARLLLTPGPPSVVLVDQANQWTVIKVVSSWLALLLLLGLGVLYLISRKYKQSSEPGLRKISETRPEAKVNSTDI
ncbi:hypothetical protein [Halocynthiibacter namhaensis]|uniref:hypothetical protein n=1 Tax=Halocynthiibacter namhaensis TaxID=1290553 RepID=UPI000579570F|nr:hypothetical protein [Halocynthiibacter namhaensis]